MTSCLLVLALLCSQETLEKRRDDLAEKLQSLRGLAFKSPLKIREGTRKEYAAYVLENARRVYGADLSAAEKGLKAMGLVPSKLRLDIALTVQAGLGTKAFCTDGELVLLDREAGDEWLLNKMNLGLVDQCYAPTIAVTYDAQMAFAALRMGDAEVIKHLLWTSNKITGETLRKVADETDAWEKGDSRFASTVVTRLFIRTADFAWRRGAVFALSLFVRGGLRALDQAYDHPPLSTEQVIHPEKYLRGEKPVTIDPAAVEEFLADKGYQTLYRTVLGELGAAILLETHFPKEDLSAASEGWGGDTFVVFEKKGTPALVLWATEWDGEPDAVEFQAQAFRLLQRVPPADAPLSATALRRNSSVVFAVNVPSELKDDLLDAVWKCKRVRD
jgi:hypothetical protein